MKCSASALPSVACCQRGQAKTTVSPEAKHYDSSSRHTRATHTMQNDVHTEEERELLLSTAVASCSRLSSFTSEDVEFMAKHLTFVAFDVDELIMQRGEASSWVGLLLSGVLVVLVKHALRRRERDEPVQRGGAVEHKGERRVGRRLARLALDQRRDLLRERPHEWGAAGCRRAQGGVQGAGAPRG